MRRRQAFAKLANRIAVIRDFKILGNTADVPLRKPVVKWSSAQKVGTAKGVCPKCGKHIGKGVTMHARHCK